MPTIKEITVIKKNTKTGEILEKIVFVSGSEVEYELILDNE